MGKRVAGQAHRRRYLAVGETFEQVFTSREYDSASRTCVRILIETFNAERLELDDVLKLLAVPTSRTAVRRFISSLMPRPPSATSQ
ncbi:hypothetical protein EB235_33330 [Mesorhizobium loti R88b]|uniref:Uncharacterized protein n=2 Tax=Rhizobium loti TaxID=381 RepID=Q8KGQ0_RHILI|nr:hypothetical protein EB235_33330 [Mesorhizobium loti R88b]CAD31623.1 HYPOTHETICAL PROTEIN [Mesorhizobium japonicum R7A]